MSDCLFCKIANGGIPAKVVFEDDRAIAFRDLNPQAPVHVLIVPKRHIASLDALELEDAALVGHLHVIAAQVARTEQIANDGYRVLFNTGANAGQTVHHIHLHLLGGRMFGWPPG